MDRTDLATPKSSILSVGHRPKVNRGLSKHTGSSSGNKKQRYDTPPRPSSVASAQYTAHDDMVPSEEPPSPRESSRAHASTAGDRSSSASRRPPRPTLPIASVESNPGSSAGNQSARERPTSRPRTARSSAGASSQAPASADLGTPRTQHFNLARDDPRDDAAEPARQRSRTAAQRDEPEVPAASPRPASVPSPTT